MKKIIKFSNLLTCFFCFLPLLVLAIDIYDPLGGRDFTDVLEGILDFLIKISIPIGAAAIAWAGFLFYTSEGEESKINKAKQTLFWALIGLLIVFGSKGLVGVIKGLLGVGSSSAPQTTIDLIKKIVDYILTGLLIISVAFIALAGFSFVTAEGEESKINKAKNYLFWGLIGIGLVLAAKGIVWVIWSFVHPRPSSPPLIPV